MQLFLKRKIEKLELLREELHSKRLTEEMKEATFQPLLMATQKNKEYRDTLASKSLMTIQKKFNLSHLDGSNHKAHNCQEKRGLEPHLVAPAMSKTTRFLGVTVDSKRELLNIRC